MGNLVKVNNVQGTPFVGINNTDNVVKLQSYRKGTSGSAGINATGETIGQARVYSFALADNAYDNTDSQFDLYMFDVQTYTKLVLNELVFAGYMPQSSYIKGLSSGATGYVSCSTRSIRKHWYSINPNLWRIYCWRANFNQ